MTFKSYFLSSRLNLLSSKSRHAVSDRDWSSDVCLSDLLALAWAWQRRVAVHPLEPALAPFPQFRFGDHWVWAVVAGVAVLITRSEERRVGKECRSRWSPYR